jgi:hypothetical protein
MAGKKILTTLLLIGLLVFAAGCSDDSAPVAPIDTAPPAVPVNVTGDYLGGYVEITWAANSVDADYAGVMITRTNGDESTALTGSAHAGTTYRDYTAQPGLNVYELVAVDQSGNASAAATVSVTLPQDGPKQDPIED